MTDDEKAKVYLADCKDISLYSYLTDKYNIKEYRQIEFIIEWVVSGNTAATAYKKIYDVEYKANHNGKSMPKASAKASASRLLTKVNFGMSDYLDLRGHGLDVLMDVLEGMRTSDPKEYVKNMLKLRGLDVQKTEHSGQVGTYSIEFTSEKVDDEEE